jgi:Nickel responsive protein SCO4226-like
MPQMIVETTYEPPATDDEIDANATKLDPCLQGHNVRWLRSYMSLDRRRRICIFDAPDADSVRVSYRSAGVKFERVWAAEEILDDEV